MSERFYVRNAWILLVLLGLLELQFGLTLALSGPSAIDNATTELQSTTWSEIEANSTEATLIDYTAKSWGVAETFVAVTIVVIAVIPFRMRERWAWYYCWIFPLFALTSVIRNAMADVTGVVLIDSLAGGLFAIPLLVTYRRFFARV